MLGNPRYKNILILCGGGNNVGDGLAVARHLHNHGCNILIALTISPEDYKADALTNFKIIQEMKLPIATADAARISASSPDLIIDAVFGTGLNRPPRDPFPAIAAAVKSLGKPVLSIDLPSGLDCDTGNPPGDCIEATRTITFVAEKIGFANPGAKNYLGQISIGDIGCPRDLVEQVLRPVPSPGNPGEG
jgi:NAD(P)H-hydrate epimerase